ncbi:hypothetical protein G3578_10870 [Brevibacillus sp. SYP-B805]|uniref:acyl-CoA reductase n=1 Tax=Brevibacillus sp. SYP-B805 TaxID=1578199 RepID=UPI0013E9CEC0|nr:acyl-CoA reductase [Brevibacillus sp. SYP-B805]NGQ95656.1 hypothetical protein [Brevibacillus sp. SYP-B805]
MDILISMEQENRSDWKNQIEQVSSQTLLEPFHESMLDFLHELSRRILLNKTMRNFPELMAMAHWLRPAHIRQIRDHYFRMASPDTVNLPRGVVLHFAPSNVDTIFIYSWVLSMLVGNINIIRLSRKRSQQIEVILQIIGEILSKEEYSQIRSRTVLLSYDHDDEITRELSAKCQLRVIWGGDETVRKIRSIPLPPSAIEMVFADRFSVAALKADAVLTASEQVFSELLRNFFNDVFWFDQLACSSPKTVFWIGEDNEITAAKTKFWNAFSEHVNHYYQKELPAIGIRRMAVAYRYASMPETRKVLMKTVSPVRIQSNELNMQMREIHCGSGVFIEIEVPTLSHLANHLTIKDQTLSVFGFQKDELVHFVKTLPNRAIDRIVPIGQSLNFSVVWDGYNLFQYFSREVSVNV